MASSNRHWPSLFKSKPCSTHHQWQHDINHPSPLHSGPCAQKPSYSSGPGCEERTPEPKPRWNPKPEQIRILEAIFNSGMVNPPRDEIRRIRAQLQEYGQVGDANVFYWFQNRKSRSKHKQRQLQSVASAGRAHSRSNATAPANLAMTNGPAAPASSSSSSSDRSSGSEKTTPPASAVALSGLIDISASPTASVNQTLFQTPAGLCAEPFLFQAPPQGHYLSELMGIIGMPEQPASVVSTGLLWSELMGQESKSKMQLHQSYAGVNVTSAAATTSATATATDISSVTAAAAASAASASADTIASPVNEMHGLGGIGIGIGVTTPARLTVFINEVAFEVMAAPLNVREAFGEEAVLLHSSGHPVLTDEWGITLQPLQNGASYYLV